jgi:plasmid maintenance system antidote protein VapI
MENELSVIKGLHPGFILERKLNEKKIAKGKFALSINEYPQTITAITKGKRNMNTALALRIEEALGLEEGYLMTLQVFYDIKQEKLKHRQLKPNLAEIRSVLFWDTPIEKIDWQRQHRAVIRRVFERGNKKEKEEIIRFYGKNRVEKVLKGK